MSETDRIHLLNLKSQITLYEIELNLKLATIKGIKKFVAEFVRYADKHNDELEFWKSPTSRKAAFIMPRPQDPSEINAIAEIFYSIEDIQDSLPEDLVQSYDLLCNLLLLTYYTEITQTIFPITEQGPTITPHEINRLLKEGRTSDRKGGPLNEEQLKIRAIYWVVLEEDQLVQVPSQESRAPSEFLEDKIANLMDEITLLKERLGESN
jgi:hypothetical protein